MAYNKTQQEHASKARIAKAREFFNQATGVGEYTPDRSRWGTLWQFQKETKKGWPILGFTANEIDRIKVNKPDWV